MSKVLRDAIVALSLSNLCFTATWSVLINRYHYSYYHWTVDPGFTEFIALALDIVVLAVVLWLAVTLVRRFPQRGVVEAARWSFLLLLVVPLNSFLRRNPFTSTFDVIWQKKLLAIALVLLALALLVALHRYRHRATRIAVLVLIVLSPLVVVNFASALWLRHKYAPSANAFLNKQPAPKEFGAPRAGQVLWIVFDELDQRLAFPARPSTIQLPELDRLRAQAVYAPNSYPPSDTTLVSMPALTTGQLLPDATRLSPDDLELTLPDQSLVYWSTQSTVFSQARSEGFRTGVMGWFNPYCRILGNSLDWCAWVSIVDFVNPTLDRLTVPQAMALWASSAFYRIPFAYRLLGNEYEAKRKKAHIEAYSRVMTLARQCLAADLNLKLLHFPVPHDPWIYDRRNGTLSSQPGNSYADNLVLADRTLGEVRQALEASGQWDAATILVTSDHWWRLSEPVNGRRDHRVPFLLKLPGQKTGLEYATPFNTIVTRELLMDLLRGNLKTAPDVPRWLDQHSTMGESNFTRNEP